MNLKIQDIASVQMGYSFRSRLEASKEGTVAVIQMKDLEDDNTVNCDNLIKIDFDTLKPHHLALQGDLIFRSRGLVNTSAILLTNPGSTIVAAPLFRIRITKVDKVLPEFLNWYISQQAAQIFFESRVKGTAQKMISMETLKLLEVPLPSIEQQKRIVELASLTAREQSLLATLAKKRKQYIETVLMKIVEGEKA